MLDGGFRFLWVLVVAAPGLAWHGMVNSTERSCLCRTLYGRFRCRIWRVALVCAAYILTESRTNSPWWPLRMTPGYKMRRRVGRSFWRYLTRSFGTSGVLCQLCPGPRPLTCWDKILTPTSLWDWKPGTCFDVVRPRGCAELRRLRWSHSSSAGTCIPSVSVSRRAWLTLSGLRRRV